LIGWKSGFIKPFEMHGWADDARTNKVELSLR